ncbi:MAG TPA: NAD(P)H-binding protein, partial [bacterium]|nr:NAD(P)H-binding protein [bacterium]
MGSLLRRVRDFAILLEETAMILVTGSTGTIGSATVQGLRSRGAKFKVATRSPEKAKAAGTEGVPFDWDDFSTYLPALQGIEKIFLLTPVGERQLGYVLQLVAAAKRAQVRHIVKLSAIGADLEPGFSILRIHRYAEQEIEDSGIAWTFLRPTFFMQNLPNFYGVTPKKDATIYLPHGNAKVAWVDGRDVGEVAAAVLTSGGHERKAYDLTGREGLSTGE